MADFSRTGISEIPNTAAPQPGVVDNSNAVAMEGVAKITDFVGGIFEDLNKKAVEDKNNKFLTGHVQSVLKIAQSVDQGIMDSNEARTRIRSLVGSTLSSSPSQHKEILKLTSDILDQTGLAKIATTGTAEEQERARVRNKAVDDGFIKVGATEDEVEEGINDYQTMKLQEKNLEFMQKEITLKSSLNSYDIAMQDKKAKDALSGYAASQFKAFRNKSFNILSGFSKGSLTSEEAVAQINGLYLEADAVASSAAHAGGDFIDNVMRPFESTKDTALKMITGEISLEIAKNRLDLFKTQSELNALNDPAITKAHGILQVLGVAGVNDPNLSALVMKNLDFDKMFSQFDESETVNILPGQSQSSKDAVLGYFGVSKKALKNVTSGYNPNNGQTKEEFKQSENKTKELTENLLDSVSKTSTEEPAKWNDTVNYLASSEFGTYVTQSGSNLSSEKLASANEVIQREYADHIIPLVRDEFSESFVRDRVDREKSKGGLIIFTKTPTKDLVQIKFDGAGITFSPIDSSNRTDQSSAMSEVKRLNKEVAPHMNRIIRATAHLSGVKDYRKVWEDTFKERLFPSLNEQPSDEGDDE